MGQHHHDGHPRALRGGRYGHCSCCAVASRKTTVCGLTANRMTHQRKEGPNMDLIGVEFKSRGGTCVPFARRRARAHFHYGEARRIAIENFGTSTIKWEIAPDAEDAASTRYCIATAMASVKGSMPSVRLIVSYPGSILADGSAFSRQNGVCMIRRYCITRALSFPPGYRASQALCAWGICHGKE